MLDLVVPALEERECCTASWELKSNCSAGSHGRNNVVCLSETPLIDTFSWFCSCYIGDLESEAANRTKKG